MFLQIIYPYMKFALGNLYPAYRTWKALKRKDETNRRRWMKYWVSFAAFQMFEFISDYTLVFIIPFYHEMKLMCIIWLVVGTKLVFDSIVNRELAKREKTIDKWLLRFSKYRNEMIAIIWFEISRCSVRLITLLMTGGVSILLTSPTAELEAIDGEKKSAYTEGEEDEEEDEIDEDASEKEELDKRKRRTTRKKPYVIKEDKMEGIEEECSTKVEYFI